MVSRRHTATLNSHLSACQEAKASHFKAEKDIIPDVALGTNILALRKRRGLSPRDIATQLGVSVQAISQWETSATKPNYKNRHALAKLFGVTIEELSGHGVPEPSGKGGVEMVEKSVGVIALRTVISILRPDLSVEDAQSLAAVCLSLALNPPDPASQASFEDQLRARVQGALAARFAEKPSQ